MAITIYHGVPAIGKLDHRHSILTSWMTRVSKCACAYGQHNRLSSGGDDEWVAALHIGSAAVLKQSRAEIVTVICCSSVDF